MPKQNPDLELLYEIGSFRFIPRTWKQFSYGQNFANDAEHSFRVAMTAMIIAKHEGVKDLSKVATMGLIHDLPESRTGDVHYMSRQYTERNEEEAMKDMFGETVLENDMISLWEEYEKRETIESQCVKDADSLDIDLELAEQASVGNQMRDKFAQHRKDGVFPRLYTDTAKKMWQAIQTHDPHTWHVEGKNRFTTGDWKN